MSVEWQLLLAILRLLVGLAPNSFRLDEEFALGSQEKEAKRLVNAVAAKGIVLSVPVSFAVGVLVKASEVCVNGGAVLPISLVAIVGILAIVALWNLIPFPRIDSQFRVIILVLLVSGLELLWEFFAAPSLAGYLCVAGP